MQVIVVEFECLLSTTEKKERFIIKLWVEVVIVTSLDAVATVDILTANNKDMNLVETRNVLFARLFTSNSRLVNLDCD